MLCAGTVIVAGVLENHYTSVRIAVLCIQMSCYGVHLPPSVEYHLTFFTGERWLFARSGECSKLEQTI